MLVDCVGVQVVFECTCSYVFAHVFMGMHVEVKINVDVFLSCFLLVICLLVLHSAGN